MTEVTRYGRRLRPYGTTRREGRHRHRRGAGHRRRDRRRFVAEGARVVVADVLDERGRRRSPPRSATRPLRALRRHAARTTGRRSSVDATTSRLLVNNAAVLHPAGIADTSVDDSAACSR